MGLNEVRGKAPAEWSWITQGGVSSIKNQAHCGSCAAFATIAVIDTCFWQQTNTMEDDLSEQHLMDCAHNHYFYDNSGAWGAFGCDGAWSPAYFDWIVQNNAGRLQTEASSPYQAQDKTCRDNDGGNYNGAHVTGQYNKWDTTEEEMKDVVYINPVSMTIMTVFMMIADVVSKTPTQTANTT